MLYCRIRQKNCGHEETEPPKVSYSIQNFIISVTYPDDEEEGGDDEEGREPSDDKL